MHQVAISCFPIDRAEPGAAAHLARDEWDRAGRFRFARDRQRFVAGRARVRRQLSELCGVPAASLEFEFGPQGKPGLVGHPEVDFNLSHAGGWAILATTTGIAVGIDIEEEQRGIARSGIAEHFFAPGEVDELMSLPDEARDLAFLECWTRKEAYLKGKGGGLSLPLDSFEVSFGPNQPARLIRADGDPTDCHDWTLVDLTRYVPRGFVAALAVHRSEGSFTLEMTDDMQRGTT